MTVPLTAHGLSSESDLSSSFRAPILHFPHVQQVLEVQMSVDPGFGAYKPQMRRDETITTLPHNMCLTATPSLLPALCSSHVRPGK